MQPKMTDEQKAALVEELSLRLADANLLEVHRATGVSYPVLTDLKHRHRSGFYSITLARVAAYFGIVVE